MFRVTAISTVAAVSLSGAGMAHAGLIEWQQVDPSDTVSEMEGFVTNDLTVHAPDGEFWTTSQMLIELDTGSIFHQDPFGSTTGPPSQALINVAADVEFDSYVHVNGDDISVAGRAENIEGTQTQQFDSERMDLTWFKTFEAGSPDTPFGAVELARITLSDDASGTWTEIHWSNVGGRFAEQSGTIVNGVIPEPGSLALLGGAGALMLLRRRK